MKRYLVQVAPNKMEDVQRSLSGLGIRPVEKAFDYIIIDIPPEVKPKVETIPNVVAVVEEKVVGISAVPPKPIPVGKKLKTWIEMLMNPFTAIQAPIFAALETRDRFPTSQSRMMLGANVAETMGITGKGVKLAILDTGIDDFILQLPPWRITVRTSTVEGEPFHIDTNGHGVHTATIAAGSPLWTPWGEIKGVAPDAEVGIFKVLGYTIGAGTTTSVLRGMMDAFEWGANIISMSLGSDIGPNERHDITACPQCRAVKALTDQGIIFVIAAGNSSEGYASCPGIAPEAITVGAVDRNGVIADFSSRGHPQYIELQKPEVVSPGVYILSSATGLIDLMQAIDGPRLA
ncbi:MAG: S8 family serine peptidase, partial [Nitrososphaerales archaeon]